MRSTIRTLLTQVGQMRLYVYSYLGLQLLCGFNLDGYALARYYALVMVPLSILYLGWCLAARPSKRILRITGILLPFGVFLVVSYLLGMF